MASPSRVPRLRDQLGAGRRGAGLHLSMSKDARSATVDVELTGHAGLRDDVRAALPGVGRDQLEAIVGDIARVDGLARQVRENMVEMGRALIRIQHAAGDVGYRSLLEAGLVPVSEGQASKLRRVATAIEDRRLSLDRLPRAMEAVYLVASLRPPQLKRLEASGALGPDATVAAIREAVRGVRQAPDGEVRPLSTAKRRSLERRRELLLAEVARIDRRLAEG